MCEIVEKTVQHVDVAYNCLLRCQHEVRRVSDVDWSLTKGLLPVKKNDVSLMNVWLSMHSSHRPHKQRRLLGWIVLLVAQVALQWVGFKHLHVLQHQRSAVLLRIFTVVLLALSQCLVGNSQRVCSDPLFSHHRFSGLLHVGELFVVNIVKRNQFWPFMILVVT